MRFCLPPAPLLFVIVLTLLSEPVRGAYTTVTLEGEAAPTTNNVKLSDAEWRWLGEKRRLRVAIWLPSNPPFEILTSRQHYSGINADYLSTLTESLGVRTRIQHYSSRALALQALQEGEADLMVDDAGMTLPDASRLAVSRAFTTHTPVLVGKNLNTTFEFDKHQRMRLAVARNYLDDRFLSALYPAARISRYDSNQSSIAAVATGQADYAVADLIGADFMIERNYANELAVVAVLPPHGSGPRFIVSNRETLLLNALNAAIKAVPAAENNAIIDRWSRGNQRQYLTTPLTLTESEQRWLTEHPRVKVSINPFSAPLNVIDEHGRFLGISADILRIIHLRTGINFYPVAEDSVTRMYEAVDNGSTDMMTTVSASQQRESRLALTRNFLVTPFVLVVKNGDTAPAGLRSGMTVAIQQDSAVSARLERRFPGIRWLPVKNAGIALQKVASGEADGAVSPLIIAAYIKDRYYPDLLRIASHLGEESARIGFAVRRDAPELQSILNKALTQIPPSFTTAVVNKWQGLPEAHQDTWKIYDTEFYGVIALAALLILSSLAWGISLRRSIRIRQQAQADLIAQLSLRDILLTGSPTPVYVINSEGVIVSRNPAFERFFTTKEKTLLSLPLYDRRQPLFPLIDDLSDLMSDAAPRQVSRHYMLGNGSELRHIIHWATPWMDGDGRLTGLICGWQDITEQQRLLAQLSQEKENADLASRAKSAFLATMSHEVRTPVSAIIGLLELVNRRQQSSSEDAESLRLAHAAAQSLLGIIGDILDMAKIESGQLELVPAWVDAESLVAETLQIFAGQAQQKGLRLSFSATEKGDHSGLDVWLDGVRLRQVLANLIGNAVKFTSAGEVRVTMNSVMQAGGRLQLSVQVADSGPGMTAEEQTQLFRPFSQLEAGRRQTGSGLGLVISKELVEKMGGGLRMHSAPGEGTEFTLQLTVPTRPRVHRASVMKVTPDSNGQMLKVLIADDHPTNRLLLRHQLEALGHRVTEAEDGIRALQLWQPEHFDLLVTDCNMPGMDGFQLTATIRRIDKNAIIWGLTANAQPEARARCLAAGMNECLFKPLQLSGLAQRLAAIPVAAPQVQSHDPVNLPGEPESKVAHFAADSVTVMPETLPEQDIPQSVPETLTASAAAPPALETLIDLAALRQFSGAHTVILRQMLEKTREENHNDAREVVRLLQQQAWPQLASCLHRIGGAASILGAARIEALCNTLEEQCRHQPDVRLFDDLLLLLKQLDHAILHWLGDSRNDD